MKFSTVAVVLVLSGGLAVPAPAQTQPGPVPPIAPLFGRGVDSTNARQGLDFYLSALQGYDSDATSDVVAQATPLELGGAFTALSPQLEFASRFGRVQVALSARSEVRYYSPLHRVLAVSHAVGAGISSQLTPRTSIFVNQDFVYAPAFLYRLLVNPSIPAPPGDLSTAAPNYAVFDGSYAYTTSLNLTHHVSARAALSFDSQVRNATFAGVTGYSNARFYSVQPRFTRSLSRHARLRLAYTSNINQFSNLQRTTAHTFDVGMEYDKLSSATRQTTLTFAIGPTLYTSVGSTVRDNSDRRYATSADFTISRQISRTWSVRGSAHRGVEFTEVVAEPVTTNGGTLAISGRLFPRTSIEATGSYTSGNTYVTGASPHLSTYSGAVTASIPLTRLTAIFIQYLYYEYLLDGFQIVVSGIPHDLRRNGVRAGFTYGVPVLRR